jgi:hypothetical protein
MSEVMIEEEQAVVQVKHIDDMDTVAFCLHMTHRHSGSLGGLAALLPDHLTGDVEDMYRAFHERLHKIYPLYELEHEHTESESARNRIHRQGPRARYNHNGSGGS